MKIAAYRHQGVHQVGVVSADLEMVTPYQLQPEQAILGALPLIEIMAKGDALPALGKPVPLKEVTLLAPLPRPRRNEIGRAHV